MTFQESIRSVLTNYANFQGRAMRSEYWYWILAYFIIVVVLQILAGVLGSPGNPSVIASSLLGLFALATLVPGLAVSVRRLHDTDRSGWFVLLALIPLVGPIILIVWYCTPGTAGPNRFGAPPLALPSARPAGV